MDSLTLMLKDYVTLELANMIAEWAYNAGRIDGKYDSADGYAETTTAKVLQEFMRERDEAKAQAETATA